MATFKLTGRVKNKITGRTFRGLTVEVWDFDAEDSDRLGTARTDARGRFAVEFDDAVFSDRGRDVRPDIFVRIYAGKTLLHSTEADPIEDWTPDHPPMVIEVKPKAPEPDPKKWFVRGRVSTANGDAVQANVSAAAISLGGERSLGQVQTDDTGRYEIVYEWDDACLPDLQATAIVQDRPIAQSDIYYAAGKMIRIDLIQGNEAYIGPTEFQRVDERIRRCNQDLNVSGFGPKQFDYLLGKTRLDEDTLAMVLAARKLASLCEVPAEVFYGLFRAKLPRSLQGLVLQSPKVLQDALDSAIHHNIIDRRYKDALDPLIAALRQMAVEGSLNSHHERDHVGMGDLLAATGIPENVQPQLVKRYFDHEGDNASFWQSLYADDRFSPYAGKVKASLQIGALALYHLPTLERFRAVMGEGADVGDLANWRESDWRSFGESLDSVPDVIVGDTPEERKRRYVDGMRRTIKRAFAREVTTANVLQSDTFSSPVLREFLMNTPEFDYAVSSIPAVLDQADIPGEQRPELEKTLKAMQRLYRLAPVERKFEVVEALFAKGVTSARDIVLQGSAGFLDSFGEVVGGADVAGQVYHQAAAVTALSTHVLAGYNELFNASHIYALGGGVPVSQPDAPGDLVIPSYRDLFGSQSFCACEHCSSVYSPAAYFVDLLEYLRQSLVTRRIDGGGYVQIVKDGQPVNKTGRDVLFERRADLGDIRLDCTNTNTVLPYIDLVNEIFEMAVAGATDAGPYQTTWSAAELKTNPEHILGAAYDVLAETFFPLTLPFRFWNVEAEHYLEHLDAPRWRVMETVRKPPDADMAEFQQICSAYLGLAQIDVDILTGAAADAGSAAAVASMWGCNGSGWRKVLARIPEFLKRSALAYTELQQLLAAAFVNADGQVVIDFSDAESACDIDGAVLRYLVGDTIDPGPLSPETFDRMQRFLRLRLKTGWSIWELDRVLVGLSETRLTAKALVQVSVLKRLSDTLGPGVLEVLSWWADMDTGLDATRPEYRSFYESVFVNPAVLNPPDPVFLLDETDRTRLAVELAGGALISGHLASIAAALQITESAAGLLAGMLLDGAGAPDDALTLTNLSRLHRMASLCRALDIDVEDYRLLERMIGPDIWNADRPEAPIGFLDAVESIRSSTFSVTELGYLFLHDSAVVAAVQMPAAAVTALLSAVQGAVRAVWVRYVKGNTPLVDQLGSRLAEYVEPEEIDAIIRLVGQTEPRTAEDTAYLEEAMSFLSPTALANAVDQGLAADVRYDRLVTLLNEYGRRAGSINVASQMIAEAFALDLSAAQLILTDIVTGGDTGGSFVIDDLLDPIFIDSGKEKAAAAIDAEYRGEAFEIIEKTTTKTDTEIAAFIDLHFDFCDTEDAKTKLVGGDVLTDILERYRYVSDPLDDALYELTEEIFPEQFDAVRRIQKTALLAGKFQISPTELDQLKEYAAQLNLLPPAGFPFEQRQENRTGFKAWRRLTEALSLRRLFVNSDTDLFSLLEKAARPALIDTLTPNPDIDALIDGGPYNEADRPLLAWWHEFAGGAGWSFAEMVYVAGTGLLKASLPDMLNVSTLMYAASVIELAERLGSTAAQLDAWSALDVTQTDAANAKQTVRARYALEQWYDIAPSLRDVVREKQRDALTACMLHRGGFGSTVDLYNFYLIDSEMSACMLTSRLKLALSSVQLFLQRCLLNLEDEFVQVSQPAEWEWRKNYRVWEANRKVFLYPENYIRPELRITRSEIFDAAQSILLQNEVTEDVAEQSLLRYLEGLDEVANLEVVGSFHEPGSSAAGLEAPERLHVVGRTRGIPHKYFYRVRDDNSWTPWEAVDADIGADQVLPVVVNRRLYILWPVFFEKQVAGVDVLGNSTMKEAKDAKVKEEISYEDYLDYLLHYDWTEENGSIFDWGYDSLEAYADTMSVYDVDDVIGWVTAMGAETWEEFSGMEKLDGKFEETFTYFEIKLAVSEYKTGKWIPSRTSALFIESDQKNSALALLDENQILATPDDLQFHTTIEDDVVIVECVQLLNFTDGTIREYLAGRFEYNVPSKEILSFNYKDKIYPYPWIEAPTGAAISGNSFMEDEEPFLEIPLVAGGWWETTHLMLLERTPGTFRVPFQHQYEQFSADEPFFFGDDKRSFMVTARADLSGFEQPVIDINQNFPELEIYVKNEVPGFGVYDFSLHTATSSRAIGEDRSRLRAAMPPAVLAPARPPTPGASSRVAGDIDPSLTASVSHYYPLSRKRYQFESFYHPLVGDLIIKVNGDGTAAALSREMQALSAKFFISAYQPTDAVVDEVPVRHFSFSDTDANGFYNHEFFFHLPLLIAMRLSRNQQFAEAQQWFHTIFDPTSRSGGAGARRFWQFKPFFDMYGGASGHPFDSIYDMLTALSADPAAADAETLALKERIEQQIAVWRANPFDPHAIAALRPTAYMKTVVAAYLNNLIAWGDELFSQFTIESINEATLYYTLAYQILGDRPAALPTLDVAARSYNELGQLDAFSNAMTEIESLINMPQTSGAGTAPVPPLYFCIPDNPNLLQLWDTVEDRLFKIRHCMTIEGVVQQLPLFQPPIPPELLVQAKAFGVSIGSVLAGLSTPAPHYRFVYLMQQAVEYCAVVKGLGSQLLAAYEKQDAEDLSLLRAEHEEGLLKAAAELRNLQVDEARENLAAMEKAKVLIEARIEYYATLEKRSEKEKAATKSLTIAENQRTTSADFELAASIANIIPTFSIGASSTGPTFSTSFGGSNVGAHFSAIAGFHRNLSAEESYNASKSGTDATYDRRWDDWKLQENLGKIELSQVQKQILAAKVRLALAEKESANHAIQLAQSREVADFLGGKFTSRELYGWMVSQTASIYFQSYKLAYELAKRCENAYQRETAEYGVTYIAYGYFDSLKKGLLSGERLHHDLQRMEFDYLNNNRREYEITKHVSLVLLDPVALLKLQTEGGCEFSVPEALFDIDHPGQYLRRIRSIAVSIPCVTGPFTSVPARLTLVSGRIRIDPTTIGDYAFDAGGEDSRFQTSTGAGQSIAISVGSEDVGLFTSDHRDERYLPFEGSGAVSDWNLTLTSAVPTFNWATITDVIVHMRFTAREGGELLRASALRSLTDQLAAVPLRRAFSARREFSSEWNAFLHPADDAADAELRLDLSLNRFPYFARNADPAIKDMAVVAVVKAPTDWNPTDIEIEAGSRTDTVTLTSSGELYGGHPNGMVSYGDGLPPAEWKMSIPLSGVEELSGVYEDLILIVTYGLVLLV